MTDLPEPLTPPECDLRDYPWMPLDTRRLLKSATWIKGAAEAKVAAMTLWCEAWHQVPAGSIEDDDEMLAALSGAGARWPKVREHALRGWVKCSDGRLYHPVVCEKAREAWDLRQAQRSRTETARRAKQQKRANGAADHGPAPVTTSVTESVTGVVTTPVAALSHDLSQAPPVPVPVPRPDSTRRTLPPVGADRAAIPRREEPRSGSMEPPSAPAGARGAVQEEGLPILRRLTGTSDRRARALLGRLLRETGDDCAAVLSALLEADDLRPIDPVPWLLRAVQARGARGSMRDPPSRREGTTERIRRELGLPSILDALDELDRPPELPRSFQGERPN